MSNKNNRPADTIALTVLSVVAMKSDLTIRYGTYTTPFGDLLLAASDGGLTHALFEDEASALQRIVRDIPKARLMAAEDPQHKAALAYFQPGLPPNISLNVKATVFQATVWRALLDVPLGRTSTYKEIAEHIDKPTASRAVGGAVGRNPVSFFIPCHRILAADGGLGGYYWGPEKKRQMLSWEAAR